MARQAWHLRWRAPSLTHILVTHHLSQTIFHTQLCHNSSSTYNFVTHHLSHRPCHPQLCHIHLFHTQSFTQLCHIQLFHAQHFCMHKLTHTQHCHTHTPLSPNLSCTISFPSCLSHLIFTSACDLWKKLICGVIRSFKIYDIFFGHANL